MGKRRMIAKATMLTGALALALVAGGCAKKVGGQVVAIVNGQEITQQELNGELNGATIPPSADKKVVMAQLLQRVIDRKLLVAKAKKEGLDQSPAYLAQIQRTQDGVLIDLLANKTGKSLPLPTAAAADTFAAENATLFGARKRYQLDQLVFTPNKDPGLPQKLRAAKTMDDVKAALSAAGIQFQTGHNGMDTGSLPPAVAKQIAALPAGEPFLIPQNGQIIASVIRAAEAVPVTPDQARPAATALLRRQALEKAMADQVKSERASAKIDYEAGFAPPKSKPSPAAN